ncbi:PP2C family protein-serine/threonine phosphatase [Sessilibacter corallicola]|uniref:Protein phosphatase 2C domain-containing protein n=1 Tax=Sessilibacter corallicola TaxID=2904075 RepID=A0ABQ0AEY1_9GAMM|nr:protein phosphatase 2C domain-containing protein [Sessilibacter corallicola]MCE2029508.1 protein phosphatase 2C domain-containing protein [Sessilibacter corallicola]
MELNYSAQTHPGAVRANNEDSFSADTDLGLFVVADGMGGHRAGEVASAMVIHQSHKYIEQGHSLVDALRQTHKDILKAGDSNHRAMGSTAVAMASNELSYEISWVGDSRAYLWDFRPAKMCLTRLTNDHSFVQTLIDRGTISEDEARVHPQRNVITQCMGNQQQKEVNAELRRLYWKQKQWIILCSDGLTTELTDKEIMKILNKCESPQDAVDQLLNEAINRGGSDNITIVVVDSPVKDSVIGNLLGGLQSLIRPSSSRT